MSSLIDELPAFGDNGLDVTRALFTSEERDGAEGALMVTAFRDFDIGVRRRRDGQTGRRVVVEIRRKTAVDFMRSGCLKGFSDEFSRLWYIIDAEHEVNVRKLRLCFIWIALGEATCDDNEPPFAV